MFSSTESDITSLRVDWVLGQGYPMDRQIYVHLVHNGTQKGFSGRFISLSLERTGSRERMLPAYHVQAPGSWLEVLS